MATESAIFTALPNGMDGAGDSLRVTVFVSPRLSTEGAGLLPLTGANFPAFADWPSTLGHLKFRVRFDGLDPLDTEADPRSIAPGSPTWHLLFGRCTVGDGTFTDLSTRQVFSVPVRTVRDAVLGLYTDVAEGFPSDFPPLNAGPLPELARQLGDLGRGKEDLYPGLERYRLEHGRAGKPGRYLDRSLIPADLRQRLGFVEAYRFYDRPGSRDPLGPRRRPPPPEVPEIDFHGFAAFCGDYPKLLRLLGLAVDLLVKRSPQISPKGRVRIEIAAPAQLGTWMTEEQARPWTHYQIQDRRFIPESRFKEDDLIDGSLMLENLRLFLVEQVDVDGAALKTADFAGNLQRLAGHVLATPGSMTENAASLPALRTGGFIVARDRRAEKIVKHLDIAASHETAHTGGTPADLFAEDVNRGYRLDVEDLQHPGRWLSLHQRTGSYRVQPPGGPAVELPIGPDEGYVKGASASSVPGDSDLYLHETMFGWDGWSLAAKRPGQAITTTGTERIEPHNPTDFPLFTEFEPTPGTLPRLRFGRTYRLRSRAVDLAGNSVPEQDLVPSHVSPPQTFRRFDPVPSPAVIPRRPFTEGESLMRMVIRSTLGILPPAYVALPRIAGLAGHADRMLSYKAENERHLAPPVASQQMAEWHGKFDAAIGQGASQNDIGHQFDVASRESGSFLDPAPHAFVFNPAGRPTDLSDPGRHKGDPLKPGEYVCHNTNDLQLPYLPDPASRGASFTILPGDSATRPQKWEEGPDWFDRKPFRILIKDGTGPSDFSGGVLTVLLPQAEMVTVRLSSFLDPADLALMGVWMLESDAARAAQQSLAEQGRHWMITPWQPLTLVHAVEKPLGQPVIEVPPDGVQRNAGETFAVLSGKIANHAKSTGRLDIDAAWTEPIDDLAQPDPSTIDGQGHVADFQLEATENSCGIGRDDIPASGANQPVHKVRHEFHNTKHRYVTYTATATTRFREYFPSEITNDPSLITSPGPGVTLDVPSSRRPDPPAVLYVVPTWTWDERTVPGLLAPGRARRPASTFLRKRTGGGLRVYLDRPWYSSGADELLGVVLTDQPWVTWPFDVVAGLEAPAVVRAAADEFAGRLLEKANVKPAGRASAPLSERLVETVRRMSRGATRPAPAGRVASAAAAALASHVAAEATVRTVRPAGELARFSKDEMAALEELISVLLKPSGDPQKFITHWGRDPIWGSGPVAAGPYIHQFPLRSAVGTGVSLLEAPGNVVTVVGHTPEFDPVRKLWYCDLQVDAGTSYFPFARLALARYQPHSIAGQHLSAVVFPDFTQLLAERTAAVTRLGRGSVSVSLRGPGGYTDNAHDLVPAMGMDADLQRLNLSRFAVAQVERLPAGATTDLAWVPAGDEIRLGLSGPGGPADVRYAATVPVPAKGRDEQLRLALREYEIFETDESAADDHMTRVVSAGDSVMLSRPLRYRLVYADNLAL